MNPLEPSKLEASIRREFGLDTKAQSDSGYLVPTRVLLDLIHSMVKEASRNRNVSLKTFLAQYRSECLKTYSFDEKLTLEEVLEWMEWDKSSHDFWEDIHCHALKEHDGYLTAQAIDQRLQQYGVSL